MNRKSGFTLIELMVVIAIIGILAAIAIPNMIRWMNQSQLNVATQELLSAMQNARVLALKQNQPVLVAFNTANGTYSVFIDVNQNDAWDAGTDTPIESGQMPGGVSMASASFTDAAGNVSSQIGFSGEGLSSGTGSVQLTDTQHNTSTITVNIAGTIQSS